MSIYTNRFQLVCCRADAPLSPVVKTQTTELANPAWLCRPDSHQQTVLFTVTSYTLVVITNLHA